jgi:hypothetical protein
MQRETRWEKKHDHHVRNWKTAVLSCFKVPQIPSANSGKSRKIFQSCQWSGVDLNQRLLKNKPSDHNKLLVSTYHLRHTVVTWLVRPVPHFNGSFLIRCSPLACLSTYSTQPTPHAFRDSEFNLQTSSTNPWTRYNVCLMVYTYTKQHRDKENLYNHASNGFRTHDPNVRAAEDSVGRSCSHSYK